MRDKSPLIFIVEDDLFYQETVKKELNAHELKNVEVFETGESCLQNLYKNPEIILLDYYLEGEKDGIHVLKEIKSVNPDAQVIMLSGQEKMEVAVNSLKYGAYDYIIKNDLAMAKVWQLVDNVMKFNTLLDNKNKLQKNRKWAMTALLLVSITAIIAFTQIK